VSEGSGCPKEGDKNQVRGRFPRAQSKFAVKLKKIQQESQVESKYPVERGKANQ
jgi:hypothetical protein